MAKKRYAGPYTYVVKVIATNYDDFEEDVFEYEYEADEDESTQEACARALSIAADGCSED